MRPSGSCRLVLAMLVAGPLCACDARGLVPDAGGGTGTGGDGPGPDPLPGLPLLSDFEDLAGATVVRAGDPPRNGNWYTYNDASPICVQTPSVGAHYVGDVPPVPPPQPPGGLGGSMALHGFWAGCTTWGAGIGADINTPLVPDGTVYTGPKVPYDLSAYSGISFLAMAAPGSDTRFRFKLPMRATTRIQDGGTCDEAVGGVDTCGDDWGQPFTLPGNGYWSQVSVKFSDPRFRQEGWGVLSRWNPRDVTGIQIQSSDVGEPYDFWIDDIYLVK